MNARFFAALFLAAFSAFAGVTSDPYTGTPVPVPSEWRAADFDKGGEGVAYHDNVPGNIGGQHRTTEDVDIVLRDGAFVVNNFGTGEWLQYTISVPATAEYTLGVLASAAQIQEVISLAVTGAPNLPFNGTSTPVTVGFVSGTPTRVELSRDGFPPFSIYPGDAAFVLSADGKSLTRNWCISAACWGNVSGTHVLTARAFYASGALSSVSVTLNVSDTAAPVSTPPSPALSASAPRFRIEVDGAAAADPVVVPYTGSWSTFAWVETRILLMAGIHKLRIVSEQQYFDLAKMRLTSPSEMLECTPQFYYCTPRK